MQSYPSTHTDFINVAGDAFVRELDVSRITVRLKEKQDKKGDNDSETTIAKLEGGTLETLQRCLVGLMTSKHIRPPADVNLTVQTDRVGA